MLLLFGWIVAASVGTAAGTSAVSGVGAADLPSIGTAAGTSAMLGVGASDLPGTGISAGAGSASGTGAADSSTAGSPAGGAGGSGVGVQPPPYNLTIGTVTGVPNATPSDASITGTPPSQLLNLVLQTGPAGATGATGAQGPIGPQGIQGPPGGGGGVGLGVNALDFAGGDLGAKINNAINAGNFDIFVPNSPGLVITTPIKILHTIQLNFSYRYPQHIVCATNDRPVFEAVGGVRNWRIRGGVFDGSNTNTPSCFLLCGRDNATGQQCGDNTAMDTVMVTGSWGIGTVINIAAEVIVFQNCALWIQGKGDASWNGPRATVLIANKDYWGVPWVYTQPNTNSGSCSAIVFQNCDIRGPEAPATCGLIKGQVEDLTIIPTYSNSGGGRAHWLFEPGLVGSSWTSPRRIAFRGGGRSECNNAAPNPFILVDGLGQGGTGIYHLDIDGMSFFESSPAVIQAINGARIHSLNWNPTNYVFPETLKLIDHRSASLDWATIKCRTTGSVDCTGQSINDGDIKIAGNVQGTVAASSRIRAANFNNW